MKNGCCGLLLWFCISGMGFCSVNPRQHCDTSSFQCGLVISRLHTHSHDQSNQLIFVIHYSCSLNLFTLMNHHPFIALTITVTVQMNRSITTILKCYCYMTLSTGGLSHTFNRPVKRVLLTTCIKLIIVRIFLSQHNSGIYREVMQYFLKSISWILVLWLHQIMFDGMVHPLRVQYLMRVMRNKLMILSVNTYHKYLIHSLAHTVSLHKYCIFLDHWLKIHWKVRNLSCFLFCGVLVVLSMKITWNSGPYVWK